MSREQKRIFMFLLIFAPCLVISAICFPEVVMAQGTGLSVDSGIASAAGTSEFVKITNVLKQTCISAGGIILIFGVIKLSTAFSSDNSQELSNGISSMIGGALLCKIGDFITDNGSGSGISINSLEDIAKAFCTGLGGILTIFGVYKTAHGLATDNPGELSSGVKTIVGGGIALSVEVYITHFKNQSFASGMTELKTIATNTVIGIGGVVAVMGVMILGIAYANDNTENLSRGVKMLAAGILCVMVTSVVGWFVK